MKQLYVKLIQSLPFSVDSRFAFVIHHVWSPVTVSKRICYYIILCVTCHCCHTVFLLKNVQHLLAKKLAFVTNEESM